MSCDFTSFLTVFQSLGRCVDDIERLCAVDPHLGLKRSTLEAGHKLRTARSAGQQLTL